MINRSSTSCALTSRQELKPPALFDRLLVFALIAIVALGLLMVASASITISERLHHNGFYYLLHQLFYLGLGLVTGALVLHMKTDIFFEYSGKLLLFAIFLLVLVIIPGIGRSVNGSMRWIGLGPFGIQVSELAKFAVVVFMASYLVRRNEEVRYEMSGFIKPIIILGCISLLLLKEPDFGASLVIVITAFGMMFLAGAPLKRFTVLLLAAIAAFGLLAVSAPYRLARLTTFLNPWADQFDRGYQLTQSLIAFGRGSFFGVGLGKSIQKLFYLPEAHTDFLFAVLAEELGLIGVLAVIALYVIFTWRALLIGRRAQKLNRHFAGFAAYGIAMWLFLQFAISIGVNIGLLPTKGLTLPLMSYGGSSLLIDSVAVALLLRIDFENRMKSFGIF